jgi:CheY-like chemotaxis protein
MCPSARLAPYGAGRVLLVEDHDEAAEATRALLERHGWQVAHARDAETALELLESGGFDPDVVLSDIAMPGAFDGAELAVHLRTVRPGLRVVLMTAYVTEVHRARLGGFDLLAKPCAAGELLAALAIGR